MALSVLLAEDDADQRQLYTVMLRLQGFEVRAFSDGREAFDDLTCTRPDVIVTDIAMPRVNGLDLILLIKSDVNYADLPIIVMTAFEKQYLDVAEELGATAAIAKPFAPEELYGAIRKAVPKPAGN